MKIIRRQLFFKAKRTSGKKGVKIFCFVWCQRLGIYHQGQALGRTQSCMITYSSVACVLYHPRAWGLLLAMVIFSTGLIGNREQLQGENTHLFIVLYAIVSKPKRYSNAIRN